MVVKHCSPRCRHLCLRDAPPAIQFSLAEVNIHCKMLSVFKIVSRTGNQRGYLSRFPPTLKVQSSTTLNVKSSYVNNWLRYPPFGPWNQGCRVLKRSLTYSVMPRLSWRDNDCNYQPSFVFSMWRLKV